MSPLAESTRILPRDLRRPRGFDRVYEITRTTPLGVTEQTLIRIDGAVTAVFPQSVYRPVAPGVSIAEFPPGTIFYIGRLPPEFGPPAIVRPPSPLAVNLSVDLSAGGRPVPPGEESPARPQPELPLAEPPSIWTHENFRRQRLAQVLRAAHATGPGRMP